MKKTMILFLAAAFVVVAAAPVGAKKPDSPGKPGSGPTNPPACTVTGENLFYEDTLFFEGAKQRTNHWIEVAPEDLANRSGLDLCVEVTLTLGRLGDMNVGLADYDDPAARRCDGLYWPSGGLKVDESFSVGFSLDGFFDGQEGFCGSDPDLYPGSLFVLVQPQLHAKPDVATLDVRVGFADVSS